MDKLPQLSALLADNATISAQGLVALALLSLAALLYAIAILRLDSGLCISLRPLAAYDRLVKAIAEAAESGKFVHLSPGTGSVGTGVTADTLAGVTTVGALTRRAAASAAPVVLSTASPVVLPLLQSAAEQAYAAADATREYDPSRVRFTGDDRYAYAIAASRILTDERVSTSLLLGDVGDEVLLLGERGQAADVSQAMGTANVRSLPYIIATAGSPIIGEEIYAGGAYVRGDPAHQASLLVQDWLRLLLVGVIIVGVVAKSLGW